MLELQIFSLLVGSLGLQAVFASGWLHWQQNTVERRYEEEEEQLTPYESRETASSETQPNGYNAASKDPRLVGWEFKIVRANRDLFREPKVFQRVCEEEAHAGWILLEKLDDRRIRFKRPIALRDIIKPEFLPYDPYRTHYGSSSNWQTVVAAIAFLFALFLPAYLGFALVSATLNSRSQTATPVNPAPASMPSAAPSNPVPSEQPSQP